MGKGPLFGEYTGVNDFFSPAEYTFMFNDFYKVYVGMTPPVEYWIQRKPWHPEVKERNRLYLWWGVGLTVLMLSFLIPCIYVENKKKKSAREDLYEKLKRLCNPSNFMKPYNKERVDKANSIYQTILDTARYDTTKLMELQRQAFLELGVSMIDETRLDELKKKVNPQNFMNPYDAEKVALANELYSRITKAGLTYEEFVEIEKESKKL